MARIINQLNHNTRNQSFLL